MIPGEKVVLTALDPANAETVRAWINNPAINRYTLVGHVPLTPGDEAAFYARMDASASDYVLEIHDKETMQLIGHVGLHRVDLRHSWGEIGIMIGDAEYHGRGYGRDAIKTMLRFGFDTLGLHRIEISARADNEPAVHLYRSIGFTQVGVHRDTDFAEGRYHDLVVMDMLESEYRALS